MVGFQIVTGGGQGLPGNGAGARKGWEGASESPGVCGPAAPPSVGCGFQALRRLHWAVLPGLVCGGEISGQALAAPSHLLAGEPGRLARRGRSGGLS